MCRTETKQSYIVLSAFERAGRPVSASELDAEIQKVIREQDFGRDVLLGRQSLRQILNELALGKMTISDREQRWTITNDGKRLRKVLGGYVKEARLEPALG